MTEDAEVLECNLRTFFDYSVCLGTKECPFRPKALLKIHGLFSDIDRAPVMIMQLDVDRGLISDLPEPGLQTELAYFPTALS